MLLVLSNLCHHKELAALVGGGMWEGRGGSLGVGQGREVKLGGVAEGGLWRRSKRRGQNHCLRRKP